MKKRIALKLISSVLIHMDQPKPDTSWIPGASLGARGFSGNLCDDLHTNHVRLFDPTVGRKVASVASGSEHDIEFHDQFMGRTPISSTQPARCGLQENLNELANVSPSIYPHDFRTYSLIECSDGMNSAMVTSVNCVFNEVFGNMTSKWEYEKFPGSLELTGKTSLKTAFQPYWSIRYPDPNGWIPSNGENMSPDYPRGSMKSSNELSLSLATSLPGVISRNNIPDRSSEINCCLNTTRLGSEQTSCNAKELSLSFGSYGPVQVSHLISGSRYLHAVQEILAQIASYSLENLEQMSVGARATTVMTVMDSNDLPEVNGYSEVQLEAVEAKESQLLTLLQVVDDKYNQCLDEIHTVISEFHAVTELDPWVHVSFNLHTISFLYKNLRERISNQILAMGANFNSGCTRSREKSFQNSFNQEQWALKQLKKDQLWRPQRGCRRSPSRFYDHGCFRTFFIPDDRGNVLGYEQDESTTKRGRNQQQLQDADQHQPPKIQHQLKAHERKKV
ncbi:PYR1-like 2 [Hibiscus syriacus]|uniref:PYR1-like 2 n=1 Tax=Hibiscus syriacus TaxID=106335 RepID=A0A6A2XQA6_HIBSY|nr:PYR1-like 2 [Hibiscus syriacus]